MIKYVDEYQDKGLVDKLLKQIEKKSAEIGRPQINIMEVCGTHTVAIFRFGIREALPENIKLISGPGCPVCVTSPEDVDFIIYLAQQPEVIVTTFGDMMKVPGSQGSLEELRASGANIRVIYSALDVLEIARQEPAKRVVFLGVGFETTSPTVAAMLMEARRLKIENLLLLPSFKLIPPAIQTLLEDNKAKIDGFILPGHVSTIIGALPYKFIQQKFHVPAVIAGFEPVDILEAIYMLLKQIADSTPKIEIEYKRSVRPEGNPIALRTLYKVFKIGDACWRGLGCISGSGLLLQNGFECFDAKKVFSPELPQTRGKTGCLCGEVLKGKITPEECRLFAGECTPDTPQGPCMVSSEGTCAAYYKYHRRK